MGHKSIMNNSNTPIGLIAVIIILSIISTWGLVDARKAKSRIRNINHKIAVLRQNTGLLKLKSRLDNSYYLNAATNDFQVAITLRNKLYKHTQNFPLSFFDKNKTGEIFSIMMNDVSNMRTAFAQSIQSLINDPITILTIFCILIITNYIIVGKHNYSIASAVCFSPSY